MNKLQKNSLIQKCFYDDSGKLVLGQFPNLPIILWFVFLVLQVPVWDEPIERTLRFLSHAFLFVWAWLELTEGANYFRRFLGLSVIVYVLWQYLTM